MLANLLLCTGLCFIVGGLRFSSGHQSFDETVTEVGGGMLLISVGALMMPLAFATSVEGAYNISPANISDRILHISHLTAVCLLIAYAVYVFFQLSTHHSLFEAMLMKSEHKNKDRHDELRRQKLTTSEAILFAAISLALVTMHAIFMVEKIEDIVEHRNVSDAFIGLILVPLVEKAAEHLTAIDEAFDGIWFSVTGASFHLANKRNRLHGLCSITHTWCYCSNLAYGGPISCHCCLDCQSSIDAEFRVVHGGVASRFGTSSSELH
jgi:Ca2+:H+ antiporter